MLIVSIHALVSLVLVPDPIAGDALRRKVIALTESSKPALIIAGDSRAQAHVMPGVVARQLGWPEEKVVNIGSPVCEMSAVLAAYREFSDRFGAAPIMLVSVSFYSVNDGATDPQFISDELLRSVGLVNRLRLVPAGRALEHTFLPERSLLRLWRGAENEIAKPVLEGGFLDAPDYKFAGFGPQAIERKAAELKRRWYGRPDIRGVRWRQFEADLGSLIDAGVQVVLLDSPFHPAFFESLAGTPLAEVDARFHRQLARLCERLNVPLLRYSAASFPDHDPDELFFDLNHLNRRGATLLSERVGRELNSLLQRGGLHGPRQHTASAPQP